MGEEEWEGWKQFLGRFMANSEIFQLAWTKARDSYGRRYRHFIDEIYEEVRATGK